MEIDARFFISGACRSGTLWLRTLLNRDPRIEVYHEMRADLRAYGPIYYGEMDPLAYLAERESPMLKRCTEHPGLGYAEVNCHIRYFLPAFAEKYGVPVAGLVRDGRFVVRSYIARGNFVKPRRQPTVRPPRQMSTFESCCWYWADCYRRMRNQGIEMFRLEDLNESYEEFSRLCEYVGAEVSRADWSEFAGKRVHVGVKDSRPPQWDRREQAVFDWMAGDVQREFGYDV